MNAPATVDAAQARFERNGVGIAYRDSAPGDQTRPAVLLLHGFPDSAAMWRAQIAFLHDLGYRVLAPDTRGCGHSDIAPRRRDYRAETVIADHVALLDHLGIARADVVGHDWGAIFAWLLAGHHPERVSRLVTLSVGHPEAYAAGGWEQKRAGWYIGLFLLAGIAERALLGRGRFRIERTMPQHPEPAELRNRMAAPGRLTAALRVYRANAVGMLTRGHPRVQAPTLGVWSRNDPFLTERQMRDSRRFVDGEWRYERLPGGHWIPLEEPARLNALLADFLGDARTPSA